MIWKTLAAVVAAIVLVIAINFIGNMVYDAGTPTEMAQDADVRGGPLPETPNVTQADVGEAGQGAQTYDDPTTEVRPSPATSLGTDDEPADQPVTQQSTVVPTEEATQFQEQAQEQVAPGEQARPEPGQAPAQAQPQQQAATAPAAPAGAAGGVAGDAAAGKTAARVCAACHTFDDGGPHRVGPNLHGVFGGDIASKDGFNYSDALKSEEGQWTVEKLDAYLENPKQAVPGNKMTYAGLKDDAKRQDLIAYMASLQ